MAILKTDTVSGIGTEGTVFEGDITFDSFNYMTLPKGTTTQSNKGRALLGGGHDGSSATNHIHYLNIQSQGNTIDFGDLTVARWIPAATASSTRGVWNGGGGPYVNTIDFVTIANTANATDFGDLTSTRTYFMGYSSSTRGIAAGGGDPSLSDVIDFVTIATTGNASDFGDSTSGNKVQSSHFASPTRAIQAGGGTPSSVNTIDFYTISTQGNAADFGDTHSFASHGHGAGSNAVRGVLMGGASYPGLNPNQNNNNAIQYVTISSLGDAIDFGDLTVQNRGQACGLSDSLRVACAGGSTDASANTATNAIEYVQIMTTGNSIDFGDMSATTLRTQGCCGDSHGGLA